MGYTTVLLIQNDAIDNITGDLEGWWKRVLRKIDRLETAHMGKESGQGYSLGDVHAGSHANPSTILTHHNVMQTSIIAVGGGCASILGVMQNSQHLSDDAQLRILHQLAAARGYKLVKT